jgi:hypothetical protein
MVLDDLFTDIDENTNPKIQITRTKTKYMHQELGNKEQDKNPKDVYCLVFVILIWILLFEIWVLLFGSC